MSSYFLFQGQLLSRRYPQLQLNKANASESIFGLRRNLCKEFVLNGFFEGF
jgi:hypothetical protein